MKFKWEIREIRGSHPHVDYDPYEMYGQKDTVLYHKDLPWRSFGPAIRLKRVMTLGYPDDQVVYYHYKIPGLDLEYGLRPLLGDIDVTEMCGYVENCKVIEVYVEIEQVVVDGKIGDETCDGNGSGSDDPDYRIDEDEENIVEKVQVDMAEFRYIVEDESDESDEEGSEDDGGMDSGSDGFESLSDEDNDPPIKSILKNLKKKKVKSHDGVLCPFYVGQSIVDREKIKSLVKSYALKTRRQLVLAKNNKHRLRVVCLGKKAKLVSGGMGQIGWIENVNEKTSRVVHKGESSEVVSGVHKGESSEVDGEVHKGESNEVVSETKKKQPPPTCTWVLHCSRKSEDEQFVVKTLIDKHLCIHTRDVKLYTTSFIAKEIEPIIKSNPTIPLVALQDMIKMKHQVEISLNKTFKAKRKAIKKMEGDYTQQFGILREYVGGVNLWIPSRCPTKLIAPQPHTQPGRPSKKRKKSKEELLDKKQKGGKAQKKRNISKEELANNIERGGKITRKGHLKQCKKCKGTGHNSRTCTQGGSNKGQGTPQVSQMASQGAPQASQNA
ncbi:hypothetical protein QVD17_17326 [Tagetes erecta]|uniref:Transposase n=1 Tax=Tagetes erecta TaxID=13708 RepID=A0AAD8P1E7_TARER|nr:hypothetical protein QVD17_17326 [Tagetes erecta]